MSRRLASLRRFWTRHRPRLDRWRRYRLILFVLSILIAIHLFNAVSALRERASDTERGFRFPLPAQAAAIAETIEAASAEELPRLLDAVNSHDIRVLVMSAQAPEANDSESEMRIRGLENTIRRYAEALAPLDVAVYLAAPEDGEDAIDDLRIVFRYAYVMSDRPLRMDIALSGDRLLRIETRDNLSQRILGWPPGLIAGAFAVFIAFFAVRAMWREIKPLTVLAARVDRFAKAARPQPMLEEGPQEIQAVIGAFNRMQGRIAELLRARSVMLGALGHDLRTYLTRLKLRADLVEDPEQQVKLIRDLDAMESVIAACTTLARLEGAPLEAQETALAPIFARLKESHPSLRITPAALATDAIVWGDRDAIHLALENLVGNALRYGRSAPDQPPDAELALSVVDDPKGAFDPQAIISVLDRGPGVAAGSEADLFKAFARGYAARNLNAPGSGLGLAIVDAVARAHRGEASLRNREGGGLEARLVLPVAF